jgi:hypothetical protein
MSPGCKDKLETLVFFPGRAPVFGCFTGRLITMEEVGPVPKDVTSLKGIFDLGVESYIN